MSYISEVFERLNIQQVREFLLFGGKTYKLRSDNYEQRLKEASKAVYDKIEAKYPDLNEYQEITYDLNNYVIVLQEVYMEIGMKCGAALLHELLFGLKN